ncbi:hypothetical protein FRC12_000261 [Ceratobasidium sp. 428]|nr:hypothetical protein FRC12_000261 [Ceratobasidium sp. 428]
MIYSISSLPQEILARVFSWASCRCKSYVDYDDVPPPIFNPVSYSAVCRDWRQVAVNDQSLWTRIDLVVDVWDDDGKYYSPEIWLERSKGAPLYVQVLQPRFPLDDEYMEDEEEESLTHLFPDPNRLPAPMVNRLMGFLSPLMPQVCSLTTFLSYPYDSTLKMLLDCWKRHGIPGRPKTLKTLSHMELAHITIRSPKSYTSFLESLEVLHLHNTVLKSWSRFLFPNLIEFETSVGEGEWTIKLPELATVLSSCPKLQRLSLSRLIIDPFPPREPKPEPSFLQDLQKLQVGGFSDALGRDGAAMLESVLALIIPGQSSLNLEVDLSYIYKSPQRAIDVVRAFVERANVTQLHVHGSQVDGLRRNPYFASQLGPLPRVQTLILEEFCFCNVVRLKPSRLNFDDSGPSIDEYNNPRPINPELVLWPDVRSLYLSECVLEEGHLRYLMSLHSVQAVYMQDCLKNLQAVLGSTAEFGSWYKSRRSIERHVQLLSQLVPKVINYPSWGVAWSSLLP